VYKSNNRFENNEYRLPSLTAKLFRWSSGLIGVTDWQRLGHDDLGRVILRG
jgi:hypothetical protein